MVMPAIKKPWYKRIKLGLEAETPPAPQEVQHMVIKTTTIGSPGTQIYAGYIGEEYLQTLQGYQRADKFDEMRRSDPQLGMCLSAVKNPILDASREIEPAGDTPEQQMHADFINHILFDGMDEEFDQFLTEALTAPEFGYALFEMTDKVVIGHKKFGSYNGIKQLGWRSPRTIHRFNVDTASAKLVSVSQFAYGDLERTVDIPAENLLLMTIQREGANYEGISLLRRCFGNYFRKDHYLRMNAIGIEKFAVPTPMVEVPSGAQNTEQYAALIEALEVYTTHQANYLTVPQDWKITMNNGVYDPEKVEKSIDAEDTRMAKAFLANFLQLGMGGGGGAYALSNDLSDFFLSGIKYIVNIISGSVNKVVIPRMIKMNFGPQEKYPTLKFSGIDDKAGVEFANMLKALAESKWLTPSDSDEDNIRKRIGMPKMSLIGQRKVDPPAPSFNPSTMMAERIRLAEKQRLLNGAR